MIIKNERQKKKKQVGELSGTREPGRAPSGQRGQGKERKSG